MRFDPEEIHASILRLMHFGVAFTALGQASPGSTFKCVSKNSRLLKV